MSMIYRNNIYTRVYIILFKVKDEISCLLENWWKSNMIWKEKVIMNAIKHLTETSKTSLVTRISIYL